MVTCYNGVSSLCSGIASHYFLLFHFQAFLGTFSAIHLHPSLSSSICNRPYFDRCAFPLNSHMSSVFINSIHWISKTSLLTPRLLMGQLEMDVGLIGLTW